MFASRDQVLHLCNALCGILEPPVENLSTFREPAATHFAGSQALCNSVNLPRDLSTFQEAAAAPFAGGQVSGDMAVRDRACAVYPQGAGVGQRVGHPALHHERCAHS